MVEVMLAAVLVRSMLHAIPLRLMPPTERDRTAKKSENCRIEWGTVSMRCPPCPATTMRLIFSSFGIKS